ncbi:MAG: MATE family efflux transporter [Pseudomonadota bacterium]
MNSLFLNWSYAKQSKHPISKGMQHAKAESESEAPPKPAVRGELVKGPVPTALMRLLLPMIVGLLAVISQPVIDTYFVALLGTRELAAMAYIFPVAFVISSILIGIGVGATAVLARQFGAGNLTEARATVFHTLLLGVIAVAIGAAVLIPFQTTLFRALGASEELLPLISEYMDVFLIGLFTMALPMLGSTSLRAKGEVKLSSLIMIVVAVVNAVLDPVLIFGFGPIPALGFKGAALASVASNFAASTMAIYLLRRGDQLLRFDMHSRDLLMENWRKVLHVGLPSALTNSISPLSGMVLVIIVARFGEAAVAGWGVAVRIEMLAIIIPLAMSACIGPFVGQNMGAGRVDRMREAMRFSFFSATVYCLFIFLIMLFFAPQIVALFDDTPATIQFTSGYLIAVSASYPLYAFIMITTGAFNALGVPRPNMVLYSLKLLVIYLPCAWYGAEYFGFNGVVAAAVISNVVPGIAALLWYRAQFPKVRPLQDVDTGLLPGAANT